MIRSWGRTRRSIKMRSWTTKKKEKKELENKREGGERGIGGGKETKEHKWQRTVEEYGNRIGEM